MSSLTNKQKNLILDLYFGCGSDEDRFQASDLISSNLDAAMLYEQMEQNFDVLGHLKEDSFRCPQHLFESTVLKLKQVSQSVSLKQLLDYELGKLDTTKKSFWKRAFDLSAIAASILIVASVYFPTVNNLRYKSWITACKSNMASIAGAVTDYANDNQGNVPAVAMQAESPWWKVGDQGNENQSNTRHLWKLVQQGYVQPGVFVCQGRSNNRPVRLDTQDTSNLKDFPDRRYITYSLQLINSENIPNIQNQRFILISDSNPIFEKIKTDQKGQNKEFSPVQLCKKLLQKNSLNHKGRGQNVMFSDGSVGYITVRYTDNKTQDDIFTISEKDFYKGTERPNRTSDIFLVP